MLTVFKLLLRFAFILVNAQLLEKFVVLAVECGIYTWDTSQNTCLTLIFAVCVACGDAFDGFLFGKPSVFDTVVEKVRVK